MANEVGNPQTVAQMSSLPHGMAEKFLTSQPRFDQLKEDEDHNLCDTRVQQSFKTQWSRVTHANDLALFGFRRFRTSHLLNLRLMEEEIKALDHKVFQAGLGMEDGSRKKGRLSLTHDEGDQPSHAGSVMINHEMTLRLRSLIKKYGMSYSDPASGVVLIAEQTKR